MSAFWKSIISLQQNNPYKTIPTPKLMYTLPNMGLEDKVPPQKIW